MIAARIRKGSLLSEERNSAALPENVVTTVSGSPMAFSESWMALTAAPSEAPGCRLKESVTAGNCPWWTMVRGASSVFKLAKALSGTAWPVEDLT